MHDDFIGAIKELVTEFPVGDPQDNYTFMGPQVSEDQWETVQFYFKKVIEIANDTVYGNAFYIKVKLSKKFFGQLFLLCARHR